MDRVDSLTGSAYLRFSCSKFAGWLLMQGNLFIGGNGQLAKSTLYIN